MNSPVCESCLNSRLIGPRPAFYPVVFILMTNDKTDKTHTHTKKAVTVSGMKCMNKRVKSTHNKSLPVAIPKELVPQIFSPANLTLEGPGEVLTTSFH